MASISKDDARGALGPHHDDLRACVESAWEHWERLLPEFHGFSRVERRNVLHGFILQEVRTRLGDVTGAMIRELKSGRVLITVEGIVLLFKHVDAGLVPSNYPTKTALKFSAQQPLPDVPKGPRVVIGYQLDKFETVLKGVFVIFLVRKKVMWDYELGKEQAGGTVTELFRETPKPPRVGPKRPKESEPPKKAGDGKKKELHTDE